MRNMQKNNTRNIPREISRNTHKRHKRKKTRDMLRMPKNTKNKRKNSRKTMKTRFERAIFFLLVSTETNKLMNASKAEKGVWPFRNPFSFNSSN